MAVTTGIAGVASITSLNI